MDIEEIAKRIVTDYAPELTKQHKEKLQEAIVNALAEWGNYVTSVDHESHKND